MEQTWTETRRDRHKTSGGTPIQKNVSFPFVTPAEMIHGLQDRDNGNAASNTRTMFRKIPAMSANECVDELLPVTFPSDVSVRDASVSAMNAPTPGTATTVLTLEEKPEVFDP